jgi:hypothetical protein
MAPASDQISVLVKGYGLERTTSDQGVWYVTEPGFCRVANARQLGFSPLDVGEEVLVNVPVLERVSGGQEVVNSAPPADHDGAGHFPDRCHCPVRIFTDGTTQELPSMTANDDRDDEQPPTRAAAGSDETEVGPAADETELVPPVTVSASKLAWSDEDGDPGGDYSWGRAAERASIIVLAAVAAAVVIGLLVWFGFSLNGQNTTPGASTSTVRPVTIEPAAALPAITGAPVPVAAPPSTVTVTAAPPPTVTVQAAPPQAPVVQPAPVVPPDEGTHVFDICPDGHEGVVGGHTSCAFAENVRRTFYNSGMSNEFTAYSPVTGDAYEITCAGRYPAHFTDGSTLISTRCYGGDNAEVVIW